MDFGPPTGLSSLNIPTHTHTYVYNSQNPVDVHCTPPRQTPLPPVPPSRGDGGGLEVEFGGCTPKKKRTWSNIKLVLSESARSHMSIPRPDVNPVVPTDPIDVSPAFVIGRLYFTSSTHVSIRNGTLDSITLTSVSLPALALQNLMNGRGPDALISSVPSSPVHSELLMDMLLVCHQQSLCLVSKTRDNVDIVLVPRVPTVAARDGVCWLVYATNLLAVELCEELRREKRVAVVLDLDQTLVDAETCGWGGGEVVVDGVRWEEVEVRRWDGSVVRGRRGWPMARNENGAEGEVFFVHYDKYLFRVRVREGWWALRKYLIDNKGKYMTFVCSKGKREYVELIYGGLDAVDHNDSLDSEPAVLIPRDVWHKRITSTWPDTMQIASDKNALMALGCAGPGDSLGAETHVAAPVVCVDDCPQTYLDLFRPNVLLVEKFQNGASMGGMDMLRVIEDLGTVWEKCAGRTGTFAWQSAQSFGMAIMNAMRSKAMESPEALEFLQGRCRKQGQLLYRQLTVEYLLPGSTPAAIERHTGLERRRRTHGHPRGHSPSTEARYGAVARRTSLELNNSDLALSSRRSLDETLFLAGSMPTMPVSIPSLSRNGSSAQNNVYHGYGGSSSVSPPGGLSPTGLSPGTIDDDLVTFSLRFKH